MFGTIYSLEQVKHYTVCPIRPIGIRWSSTEWFRTATVCLFGGRLRPYNVAYLYGFFPSLLLLSLWPQSSHPQKEEELATNLLQWLKGVILH